MKRISRIKALKKDLQQARKARTIGFVPTMGAFHKGHLSLIRKAKKECDLVVVSLFVNPLQFGPKEDLAIYPRDLSSDRKKAAALGVDLLWTPSEKAFFPSSFQTTVDVGEVGRRWEATSRPGHFKGVATIVTMLLMIVQPHRLYLGQKDYQQTRVIAQMIEDLHFDTQIRISPTVREIDGLAMSSRNSRLSKSDRQIAPNLYCALRQAKALVRSGERRARPILKAVESILRSEKRIEVDYLTLCDSNRLEPIHRIEQSAVLLAAVKIGRVRLIDNVVLKIDSKGKRS